MAKKKLTFWIDESAADRVRKRAIAEGRTLSEIGGAIVEKGLSSDSESVSIQHSDFDLSSFEKMLDKKLSGFKTLPVSEQKPAQISVQKQEKHNRKVDTHVAQMIAMSYQLCVEISKKLVNDHELRIRRSESLFETVERKYPDSYESDFDKTVFSLSTKTLSILKGISAEINKNDVQNHARSIEKSTSFFKSIQQKLGLPEEEE